MQGHYILKLNNKCNLNCLFCADPLEVRSEKDPHLKDVFRKLLKNRKDFDSLILTGGEPTVYRKFFLVLRFAKEICKYERICLVTNGLLLSNPKVINRIISEGVDSVQLSYYANEPEKYEAISRKRGTFSMAQKALENLTKAKVPLRINLVIHKQNYKDLPDIVLYLIKKRVSAITLAFINPSGESVRKGNSILALNYKTVVPFLKKAFDIAEEKHFHSLFIENFPLCVVRMYMNKVSDLKQPAGNKEYYTKNKVKPEKCRACTYNGLCDGMMRAQLKQFGDDEITPIKLEEKKEHSPGFSILPSEENIFTTHIFELLGLEQDAKKASILYAPESRISFYTRQLQKKGYVYALSDFSFLTGDEITRKVKKRTKKGELSLYIAKEGTTLKRLKYLDYYQQFKETEPSGMTSEEIFFEISKMLGYPRCCSSFLLECHKNGSCEDLSVASGHQYQEETIYKFLGWERSKKASYLLNNFSLSYPKLINFFVCHYDCKEAKKIAEKVLAEMKERYPREHKRIVADLKAPFVFFSAYRIIFFRHIEQRDGKIYYKDPSLQEEPLRGIAKEKRLTFEKQYRMFLEGDSFRIERESILIYRRDSLVHYIQRMHPFDGIFVHFDKKDENTLEAKRTFCEIGR